MSNDLQAEICLLSEKHYLNDGDVLYLINPLQSSQWVGGVNLITIGFVLDFTQIEISHQEVTSFSTWICLDLPQICQGFEICLDLSPP